MFSHFVFIDRLVCVGGAMLGNIQGIFLALCSGIIFGSAMGTTWDAGDQTQDSSLQVNTLPTVLSLESLLVIF